MKRFQLLLACLLASAFANLLAAQCTVNAGTDVTIYPDYAPLSCAMLTATPMGVAPFTFTWSSGDTTPTILACDSTSATYIVTVTDSSGCTATDTVQLNAVNVSCHPNGRKVLVCHVPPGNPANAHDICVSINAVPAHLAHGDYLGPCAVVPPAGCSVNLGADVAICPGTSLTLDAGTGYASYLWSDSSTAQTLTVDSAGIYSVSVTDSAGCTASDTIPVAIDSNALAVNAGADQTLRCNDTCAILLATVTNGTSPYSYLWTTGDTAASITVCDSVTTTYAVTVVDSFGCSGADTVIVVVNSNALVVNAGADQTIGCNDSCAVLSVTVSNGIPPYTYSWSIGDTTATVTVCDSVTATYYVTVTDSSGCIASDSVEVNVWGNVCGSNKVLICHVPPGNPLRSHNICISAKAVNAHLNHGDYLGCCNPVIMIGPRLGARLIAIPSPAFSKVSLEYSLPDADYIYIDLYSISGKKISNVFEGYSDGDSGIVDADLQDLPQGMYVAEIKTSGGLVYHEKFTLLK